MNQLEDDLIEHHEFEEKIINAPDGWCMLYVSLTLLVVSVVSLGGAIAAPALSMDYLMVGYAIMPICFISMFVICTGLLAVQPNTAILLMFCGKYVGTIKSTGYVYVNPFYSKEVVSLKA